MLGKHGNQRSKDFIRYVAGLQSNELTDDLVVSFPWVIRSGKLHQKSPAPYEPRLQV